MIDDIKIHIFNLRADSFITDSFKLLSFQIKTVSENYIEFTEKLYIISQLSYNLLIKNNVM